MTLSLPLIVKRLARQLQFVLVEQYHQWDDASMVKAMRAVESGISIRRASEMYDVPKSSLYDRVSGKVQHGCRPGPVTYLSMEEEDELVHFLIRCSEIGYPHTLSQVLALVQQIKG